MFEPVPLSIRKQSCWLSPQRCLYWEEASAIFTGGFQLGRFPISPTISTRQSSLDRLQEQVLRFKATRVILIGGFLLPENNQYLEEFIQWRTRFGSLRLDCVLARSNPVAESLLLSLGAQLHQGLLEEGPFCWVASRIAEDKWRQQNDNLSFMISGYRDPGYKNTVHLKIYRVHPPSISPQPSAYCQPLADPWAKTRLSQEMMSWFG